MPCWPALARQDRHLYERKKISGRPRLESTRESSPDEIQDCRNEKAPAAPSPSRISNLLSSSALHRPDQVLKVPRMNRKDDVSWLRLVTGCWHNRLGKKWRLDILRIPPYRPAH